MNYIYPFLIAFSFIFISELGDKTQLLVLSFSSKIKTSIILLGVALGSFFSHGVAIIFGSALGSFNNPVFHIVLKILTYATFILFGFFILFNKNKNSDNTNENKMVKKYVNFSFAYIFIIALTIAVGELGDKTFLASIGLGIDYSLYKFSLILGAILGMVASDFIAIVFGKYINSKVSSSTIDIISAFLFLLFGVLGFLSILLK